MTLASLLGQQVGKGLARMSANVRLADKAPHEVREGLLRRLGRADGGSPSIEQAPVDGVVHQGDFESASW